MILFVAIFDLEDPMLGTGQWAIFTRNAAGEESAVK
jgi:hypothetical protein